MSMTPTPDIQMKSGPEAFMTKPDLAAFKPFSIAAEATPPVRGATELRGVLAMQALSRKDAVESNSPKRILLSTEMVAYSWEKAIGQNIDQDAAAERRMKYKGRSASGKPSVADRTAQLRAMGISQDQQMSAPVETGLQGEAKFMAEYLEAVKPDDIKFVAGETRKRVIVSEQTQAAGDVLAVPNIGEKRRLSSETLPSSSGEIRPVLSTPESRRVVGEGVAQSQGEVQRVDAEVGVRVFTAESLPVSAGQIYPSFEPSQTQAVIGEGVGRLIDEIRTFDRQAVATALVQSVPLRSRGEIHAEPQTRGVKVIESTPLGRDQDQIEVMFRDPRRQKVESGLPTKDNVAGILSVSHDQPGQRVVAREGLAAEPQNELIVKFAPPSTRRVTAAPVRIMEPVQIAKRTEKDEEEGKEKSEKVVAQMPEEPGVIKYVHSLSSKTVTGEGVDDAEPGEIRAIPVRDRYEHIVQRAIGTRRTDDGLERITTIKKFYKESDRHRRRIDRKSADRFPSDAASKRFEKGNQ